MKTLPRLWEGQRGQHDMESFLFDFVVERRRTHRHQFVVGVFWYFFELKCVDKQCYEESVGILYLLGSESFRCSLIAFRQLGGDMLI